MKTAVSCWLSGWLLAWPRTWLFRTTPLVWWPSWRWFDWCWFSKFYSVLQELHFGEKIGWFSIRWMNFSETYCQRHIKRLLNVLETTESLELRKTLLIGFSDIAVRFVNLVQKHTDVFTRQYVTVHVFTASFPYFSVVEINFLVATFQVENISQTFNQSINQSINQASNCYISLLHFTNNKINQSINQSIVVSHYYISQTIKLINQSINWSIS